MLRAYGNGTVFAESYGDGSPRVLWLHGWGRRGADFEASARSLGGSSTASVALDLPGFGSSPAPESAGGARYYADLLAPVIAEMSDEPLVIVGHSFGGRIAVVLAARHPELVRALVLTGVPLVKRGPSRRSPVSYRVVRRLHSWGLVGEARMETARQKYGSADYRAARGVMREILVATVNESYESELAAWRGPTALVWGRNDTDVPLEVAQRAATLLGAQVSITVLDGVGHLVPTQAPSALVAATRELL